MAKTRAGFTKSSSSAKNNMKPLFLFDHRFCHPKFTPKNHSEDVYRDKKNLPVNLTYSRDHTLITDFVQLYFGEKWSEIV